MLKKFTLLFLRLKLPFVPVCSGIPTLKFILPLNPNRSCFFRIIFKIPAVPSASYLADGDVTTSTCWIDSDGIDLRPSGPDNPTRPDGFPFINILTLLLPLNDIFPSISTSRDGMFAKTSLTLPPLTVIS